MVMVAAGMSVFLLTVGAVYGFLADGLRMDARVFTITRGMHHAGGTERPPSGRVLGSSVRLVRQLVLRLTPKNLVAAADKALERAGYPSDLDGATLVFRQVLGMVLVLSLAALAAMGVPDLPPWLPLAFALLALFVVVLPYVNLSDQASRRRKTMQVGFPDFLDLLVVCVESGLGMDAALHRVVRESKGPLAEEFGRAVAEIQVTRSRGEALTNIARRTGLDDVARFALAVRQAEQTGVGITLVLKAQADLVRDFALRRAEEKAARIPVKMVIPVVLFVLPTLFIVVLGPAVLQMASVFSHG